MTNYFNLQKVAQQQSLPYSNQVWVQMKDKDGNIKYLVNFLDKDNQQRGYINLVVLAPNQSEATMQVYDKFQAAMIHDITRELVKLRVQKGSKPRMRAKQWQNRIDPAQLQSLYSRQRKTLQNKLNKQIR